MNFLFLGMQRSKNCLKTKWNANTNQVSLLGNAKMRSFKNKLKYIQMKFLFLEMQRWNRLNTNTNQVSPSGNAEMKSSNKNGMIPSLHVAFTKSVWIPYPLRFIWQNISDRQKTFGTYCWKFLSENWLRTLCTDSGRSIYVGC